MANSPYVQKPGKDNETVTQAAPKTDVMTRPAPKKEKKYRLLNAVIIIMTIILFFMIVGLIGSTAPRTDSFYDKCSADDLIRKMNFSGYQRLLEAKYENESLGITADTNSSFVVPYAIADYYEAAFNYRGYAGAGDPGAADYKEEMKQARASMGEYEYIADDIDEFIGIR